MLSIYTVVLITLLFGNSDLFKQFDLLFSKVDKKSYHIYTYSYDSLDATYKGVIIPNELLTVIEEISDSYMNFFAVFKFPYSEKLNAYIIRQPSQYDESLIRIYLIDRITKKVILKQDLADHFGDEGWSFQQDSWLEDINNDGNLDIITRKVDTEVNPEETNHENEEIKIISDIISCYLFKDGKFISSKIDYHKYSKRYILKII